MSNKENVLLDVSIRLLDGFHLLDGFQLDDESPIPPIPLSDGGELFIHVDLETKNAVFKIRGVKPGDRIKHYCFRVSSDNKERGQLDPYKWSQWFELSRNQVLLSNAEHGGFSFKVNLIELRAGGGWVSISLSKFTLTDGFEDDKEEDEKDEENVLLDVNIQLDEAQLNDKSSILATPLNGGGMISIRVDLETKNAFFKIGGVEPDTRVKHFCFRVSSNNKELGQLAPYKWSQWFKVSRKVFLHSHAEYGGFIFKVNLLELLAVDGRVSISLSKFTLTDGFEDDKKADKAE